MLDISWLIKKLLCRRTRQNSKGHKINHLQWKTKHRYCVGKSSPVISILTQMNLFHITTQSLRFKFMLYSNLHTDFQNILTPLELSDWGFVCIANFLMCFAFLFPFGVLPLIPLTYVGACKLWNSSLDGFRSLLSRLLLGQHVVFRQPQIYDIPLRCETKFHTQTNSILPKKPYIGIFVCWWYISVHIRPCKA